MVVASSRQDAWSKNTMYYNVLYMVQVICEPLVLTLAYVGMVGPLSTPDTLHPGPKGDKVPFFGMQYHLM